MSFSEEDDDDMLLVSGDKTLNLSQFTIGREIGKGQFSVVHKAIYKPDRRAVAIKRVQLFEMVDSQARTDCIKEIQLLKVNFFFFNRYNVSMIIKNMFVSKDQQPSFLFVLTAVNLYVLDR